MRLTAFKVQNYRSIKSCDGVRVEPLQALVGENNAGKSNLLKALSVFLTSGAGGTSPTDFNDRQKPIVIECEFSGLSAGETNRLAPYLMGDKLILQKTLMLVEDEKSGKIKVESEYHGYQAEPADWWLSITKIEANIAKPNWKEIAEQNGLAELAQTPDGKFNKTSYRSGISKFLSANLVAYDPPTLGETQALGLQPNLLAALPALYLLPAITDYSNEIDRRSSSTVFRRLMGELSDRIVKADDRYAELEAAISTVRQLLNSLGGDEAVQRLGTFSTVETGLAEIIAKLMPSVRGVRLDVTVDEPRELFSRGIALQVDDGVMTDVLEKGHGLQRSVVFGLLQMLIKTTRETQGENIERRPIILCIEEPELYIHPQSQRLVFSVLKAFATSGSDQVLYTTHSPAFVDVGFYERIALVWKQDAETGSVVRQCEAGVLGSLEERKGFQLLTSFSLKHNELFFARNILLVEGPEDEIAVVATARVLGHIVDLPDERGLAVVVVTNKQSMVKFQKLLNAFRVPYRVLLELDGQPETDGDNELILGLLNGNGVVTLPNTLEDMLGLQHHFKKVYDAHQFFAAADNINAAWREKVEQLLL